MASDETKSKDFPYLLSLDLGAQSVGWAILSVDGDARERVEEPIDLFQAGARVFEAGVTGDIEAGKEESRAKDRRLQRGIRRRLDRTAMRTYRLFTGLQTAGLLPPFPPGHEQKTRADQRADRHQVIIDLDRALAPARIERLVAAGLAAAAAEREVRRKLPYLLRAAALDQPLAPLEFGRALLHLGQRRGFLSNKKAPPKKDEDQGEVKAEIKKLYDQMGTSHARSLGEYLAGLDPDQRRLRARWTARQMYLDEFEKIWDVQAGRNPDLLSPELKKKIHRAIFHQRPLKSAAALIGDCELERGTKDRDGKVLIPPRKRAPVAILDFQRFRILQTVSNLRVRAGSSFGVRPLTEEERRLLITALETGPEGDLTVAAAKKILDLPKGHSFSLESGPAKKLIGNRTAAWLRPLFANSGKKKWDELDRAEQDQVVEDILTIADDDACARRAQHHWGLDPDSARAFAVLELEPGYGGLSRKALGKLLPFMEQGKHYMEAVDQLYDPELPAPMDFLPPVKDAVNNLRNPAVERTLTELRKVVNAIVREHGKPAMIRLELARDLKRSKSDRQQFTKRIRENEKQRDSAREALIKECGLPDPRPRDVLKYRLWKECNGECPYTGQRISAEALFGMNARFDIEHIVPLSRCLDNGFANKTLCENEENKRKGNRSPFEVYGDTDRWDQIVARVKKFDSDAAELKLRRFIATTEDLTERYGDFSERMLAETRYASKLAAQYVGLLYGGKVDDQGVLRVRVSTGQITAHVRAELRLNTILNDGGEKTRTDHRHHAVDAIAIGLSSPAMVKRLADAATKPEHERRRHLFAPIDPPWEGFIETAWRAINDVVVSHRVDRSVNAGLHEETIYSPPEKDRDGKTFVKIRKPIDRLSAGDVENIVDEEIKQAVKAKLAELGKPPKDAFKDSKNHPALVAKDGEKRPIHKVRIKKYETTRAIAAGPRQRNVITGSNHHLEVLEVKDKKGKIKWDAAVVSTLEAMRRLKMKEPIVNKDHGPDQKFLFSLTQGDAIEIDEGEGKRGLYVVRGISTSRVGGHEYPVIYYVKINDARMKKDMLATKDFKSSLMEPLRKLNGRKVSVDPLGRVRRAND